MCILKNPRVQDFARILELCMSELVQATLIHLTEVE